LECLFLGNIARVPSGNVPYVLFLYPWWVLFFLAGVVVYNFGPGRLLVTQHIVLRMIVAILLVALYTGLGIVAGLVLGGTSSIRRKLPAAQEGIHTMLAPVTSRIIERIPVGQEGIALEKFTLLVNTGINSVASESQQRSRLLSFASFGARILVQRLLRICRALFVVTTMPKSPFILSRSQNLSRVSPCDLHVR
jgi:predicted PurR-regulated permease PerM